MFFVWIWYIADIPYNYLILRTGLPRVTLCLKIGSPRAKGWSFSMLGQNQGARSCQKSIFCWSCWAAVLQSDCRSPPPQQRIQRKQSTREEMGQEGRSLDASDFLRHHSDAIQMPFRCHSDAIRAKTHFHSVQLCLATLRNRKLTRRSWTAPWFLTSLYSRVCFGQWPGIFDMVRACQSWPAKQIPPWFHPLWMLWSAMRQDWREHHRGRLDSPSQGGLAVADSFAGRLQWANVNWSNLSIYYLTIYYKYICHPPPYIFICLQTDFEEFPAALETFWWKVNHLDHRC